MKNHAAGRHTRFATSGFTPCRFKPSGLTRAISTALLFGGLALSARAADETVTNTDEERIVVTAQGRSQRIQDVPYNISAVSGEDIEAGQIIDAAELMRSVPGVSVVDRGYRNSGVMSGIMIRGLNVDSATLGDYQLSTVPTVSTYVNSTPIYANFILKDVDRVEILRGPQGTLYGSGSLGGTVRFLMREPELGEFTGKVGASYSVTDGSDGNNTTFDAMLNLPLAETVALRLVAGTVDYYGVTDYVNLYQLDSNGSPVIPSGGPTVNNSNDPALYHSKNDADTVDIEHLRASLRVAPSESFSALLSYQTQSDDIGGRRQFTRGVDGFGNAYADGENGSVQLEPSSREVSLMSLEMEIDLGFATLTTSSSDYQHDGSSVSENTGYYAQNQWLANFYYNYPRPMASAVRGYADDATIHEVRLVSKDNENFDYLVGVYQMDQDLVANQTSYLRGFKAWADAAWGIPSGVIDDRDFGYLRNQTVTDDAFFGEFTWHASPELHFSLGLRHYDTTVDNDTSMFVSFYEAFRPEVQLQDSDNDTGTLTKINAAYELSGNAMIYFTRSEGYRHGGANAIPLAGFFAEDPEWQSYEADTTTNYEFGIKGDSNGARYTIALFQVDWRDIQLNVATPNWGFFAAANGGEASTQGLEAQWESSFDNGVTLALGYTYVDAKLDEDVYAANDPDQLGAPIALAGTQLPGTAEHSVNLGLSHTLYTDTGLIWTSRLGIYSQTESENSVSTSVRAKQTLDAFSLLDGSLTVAGDSWDVSLFFKNITNDGGVTGVLKEEYMGTDPAQNYYGNGNKEFVSMPRTIGLAFNYQF